jgi:hypothetical protein
MWFDKQSLVLRRYASSGGDCRYSDYRPLEGSRLSIPWRIECRRLSGGQIEHYVVKRALANDAVSDSIFTQPFHPDAKRISPPPPNTSGALP